MKPLYLIIMVIALVSCKENKKPAETEQIVAEWMGKEIRFPDDYQCRFVGNDTTLNLCADLLHAEYKVLLYVDSAGCSSCRFRLSEWNKLIEESDSLFMGKVNFLFFFQPKSVKEMLLLKL